MSDSLRRPGPEPKLETVRDALIEAATDELLASGVKIGLGHIKLSDAIARAGVARATAYRSLASDELDPQQQLHFEVLSRLLSRSARAHTLRAVEIALAAELERLDASIGSEDPDVRAACVRSIIRVGASASYHAVAVSAERAILTAAYGAIKSQSDHAVEWQKQALRKGEQDIARLYAETYGGLSAMFGYGLRPGFTMEQFATAAAALVEGIALRAGVSDELENILRPTADDGSEEPWTLFAIAFEGVYSAFFHQV